MNATTPRRRPSKAVYRRRRLVVLLALLLVIAGIVLAIVQPWAGSATPAPNATAATTQPAAASSAPAPISSSPAPVASQSSTGDIEPCTPEQITVTAKTDKQTYAAGENPQLSAVLANTSGVDCWIDAGTASQKYEISSGDEVYWRSTDCQADPANQVVTLTAGQEVASASPLVWDRTRSSGDTCESTDRATAPAGGASYHLRVTIGGMVSKDTAQFILN